MEIIVDTTNISIQKALRAHFFMDFVKYCTHIHDYGQIDLNLEVCISNIMCTGQ
jgi:hypothetical protein